MSKVNTGSWAKAVKSTKPSKQPVRQTRSKKAAPMPTVQKEKPTASPNSKPSPFKIRMAKKKVPPPFAHQLETVKVLLRENATLDASDPGTAKTRGHLEAWAHRRREDGGKCLLVLAPKSILQSAWGNDIDKFFPEEFTYSVAYATNREAAFEQEADVYITNIDAAKWLSNRPASFFKKFDEIIIDESESIKHRTSARSKAAAKISKYFPYRRCLSGTPHSQTIAEVWHQYFILDGGDRLGRSFFKFRGEVCEPKQNGPRPEHVKWVDREGAEAWVSGLVKDITIRNKFENCHDIPPIHDYYVYTDLTPKHRARYEELKEQSKIVLETESVTAVHAASLRTKLFQLLSGAVYGDDEDYALIDTSRYELIMDTVAPRDHSLVFFNWQHQKHELAKLAEKLKYEYEVIDGTVPDKRRNQIVQAFQAGHYKVLFLQPKSAAHGLTLTRSRTTIWASPPDAQANVMRQGKGRVYRAGQTGKTENIMVCANDTIEEGIYETLLKRKESMENLLEMLV